MWTTCWSLEPRNSGPGSSQDWKKDYKIGSTSENEAIFCERRMRFQGDELILVDQDLAVEEIAEIEIPAKMELQDPCEGALHTEYRRALGQLSWIQSRTQFQFG